MAGILNSKKRIMDTIVLPSGRRQAFGGHMQFRYVTLTDRHAYYDTTGSDSMGNQVATDAADRIYFEASARPHDLLCPETDLNAKIVFPSDTIFQNSDVVGMAQSDMLTIQGAFPTVNSLNDQGKVATGKDYLDSFLAANISQAITSSYVHQHFLASPDPLHFFESFELNKNELNLAAEYRFGNSLQENIKDLPPVYQDPTFFRHTNFQFLPPINKLPKYANVKRIMPWIVSNLDLKQFEFSQYKEYFGIINELLSTDDKALF